MNPREEVKYAWEWSYAWVRFAARQLITNPDIVLEGADHTLHERWSRRSKIRILRPRYQGLLRKLPCGCSKRLGHFVYYSGACLEHGSLGRALAERRREREEDLD